MLGGGDRDHECQLLKEHLFPAGSADNAAAHQGAGEAIHHGPRELIGCPSGAGGGHLERWGGWRGSGGRLFIWPAGTWEPGRNILRAEGREDVSLQSTGGWGWGGGGWRRVRGWSPIHACIRMPADTPPRVREV